MDINWFPGHMAKAMRELREAIRQVDLVLETRDARIPQASGNPELDGLIGGKPRIVVLCKSDLADPRMTALWLTRLTKPDQPVIALDATHRKGLTGLRTMIDAATRIRREKAESKGRTVATSRVLVAGIPNSGKSTLINSLSGRRAARTEDRPGVTRGPTWISAGDRLELLDSPGVLWPRLGSARQKLLLAATGAIRDEILPLQDVAAAMFSLLADLYPEALAARYGIDIGTAEEIFEKAARKRGCLLSGGRADLNRFSVLFLDELRAGRIGRLTLEQPSETG